MEQYVRTKDEDLRAIFVHTLEKMARGGVYDQLAGGFHRYSVDERWIVRTSRRCAMTTRSC